VSTLAPLPVAVPLAVAALLLVLRRLLPRQAATGIALASALTVIGMCLALAHGAHGGTVVHWFGGWTPRQGVAVGVSFVIDPLGAGAAAFSGLVVAVAVLAVPGSIDEGDGLVHALLMVLLAAMAGFCLTGDLFNLFVFFELMAVTAFGLAAYQADRRQALAGALNFAVTNTIGAFLLLIGIALLYGRTGALNLAQIGRALSAANRPDHLVVLAFALIAVGFLIKAAIVPFHFWLIQTASSAPLPLTLVLAGALDLLGLYALARVYWTVFAAPLGGAGEAVRGLLVGLGATTALIGAVLALAPLSPRTVLAFVMVSHAGILLLGIGCLAATGLAGAAVYAVGDGTAKAALFLVVASTGEDAAPATDGREAAGRWTASRWRAGRAAPALLLACGGLAIAGLPLFGTGVGKVMIESGLARSGYAWLTPVVVAASALTGAAVLRLAFRRPERREEDVPVGETRSLGLVMAGALLALSVSAAFVMDRWATAGAGRFVASRAYQAVVLDGRAQRLIPPVGAVHLDSTGIGLDLGAAALAVALAVSWHRLRTWLAGRSWRASGASALAAVLRVHSASIGDSAAWVTLGTAGVGLLLALRIH
jgi:multicomponent Na+:H+ antiporter subunit D